VAKKEEQAVLIFERKIFRRIYCAKYEKGEWKSGTNRELEEMSKGENIVKWIKGQRISWLGHLERMEEGRMPKKVFTQELEGTRRWGRPRKSWKEEVERELQVLGVRRWRGSWWQIRKSGRTLFDRRKPTVDCSANGRRRRRRRRRRRGRPKKRWKEEVERELQVLGVRRWRELVADRKKWKDIVRQAKAHSGL